MRQEHKDADLVIKKYTEKQKEDAFLIEERLQKATASLREDKKILAKCVDEIIEKGDEFKNRVNDLVEKVDSKFREMMDLLDNAGEVRLEGSSGGHFKDFGLSILVKFSSGKNSGGMQKFHASVQSGGEKSVVTAVYMMALQEMTKVPFRCVDEINQGMDEKNERKVWQLLLRIATNYSAQYFYFAPKFPRNLDFSDKMRIIFCVTGSVVKSKSSCDMEKLIKRAARKRKLSFL